MLIFLLLFILDNGNNYNKNRGCCFFIFSLTLIVTMRVAYVQPSALGYDEIFLRSGSGKGALDIQIYRPGLHSRGIGLLGVISTLAKRVLPFLANYILPEAGQFFQGLLQDVTHGKGVKKSVKSQAKKTVKRVINRVARGKGAGRARGRGYARGRGHRELFQRLRK